MNDGYADPRDLVAAVLNPFIPPVKILTDESLSHLPVAHLVHIGGIVSDFDRSDEIRIDVYAPPDVQGFDAARNLAGKLTLALQIPAYHDTSAGFIDRVLIGKVDEAAPGSQVQGPYIVCGMNVHVIHRPQ